MKFLRMPHTDLLHHFSDLKGVSRARRLFTVKGFRHVRGLAVGVAFMGVGSSMAVYHWLPLHHLPTDVLAYLLHGLGCYPIAEHTRPLWVMLQVLDD